MTLINFRTIVKNTARMMAKAILIEPNTTPKCKNILRHNKIYQLHRMPQNQTFKLSVTCDHHHYYCRSYETVFFNILQLFNRETKIIINFEKPYRYYRSR